nr:hypothetical protein [Tanacetum cinerariifolium]
MDETKQQFLSAQVTEQVNAALENLTVRLEAMIDAAMGNANKTLETSWMYGEGTCSSYNFVNTSRTKKIRCRISSIVPLQGKKMPQSAPELSSMMLCVYPVAGLSMIHAEENIQWLATLGNIQWNFSKLKMAFEYKDMIVTLRGTHKSPLQWMQGKKMPQSAPELSSMMLCVYPVAGLSMIHAEENIQEGAVPVNVRPYRHPPTKKDVIESMVREILETRVIRESQCSFASLVFMVKKKDVSGECVLTIDILML